MKEAQYILQSVTTRSLVILDELCRHTTVEEGSAIAWSICERLSLTTAFTFAATHFLHLTALSDMYYNVTTYVKVLQEMYLYLLSEKKKELLLRLLIVASDIASRRQPRKRKDRASCISYTLTN